MNVETIQRRRRVSLHMTDRCQRRPEEPPMCMVAYGKHVGWRHDRRHSRSRTASQSAGLICVPNQSPISPCSGPTKGPPQIPAHS